MSKGLIQANRMFEWILQEQYAMYMIDSTFVIDLMGSFHDDQFCYFVIKFCEGGSLFDLLIHERLENPQLKQTNDASYYLQEKDARFYMGCAVQGLEHMHKKGIINRDIKSDNMLIDSEGYLLLADLGFAKPIGSSKTYTICGTKEYFAPELVNKKGYDLMVDWWALGVAFYDMSTGFIPYDNPREKLRDKNIQAGKVQLYLHDFLSAPTKNLLTGLLHLDPKQRFGSKDKGGTLSIKYHEYFKDFDWSALEKRQIPSPWKPGIRMERKRKVKDAAFSKYETRPPRPDPFNDFRGHKYGGVLDFARKKKGKKEAYRPKGRE